MKNRLFAFLVALVLCLGTVTTAFALSASTSRSTCRSQWTNFTVQKYGGSNNTSESVRAIKVIISGISNHLYEEVMNSCNGFSGTFSSALKNAVIHAQQDIFKNDSSQWDGSLVRRLGESFMIPSVVHIRERARHITGIRRRILVILEAITSSRRSVMLHGGLRFLESDW